MLLFAVTDKTDRARMRK